MKIGIYQSVRADSNCPACNQTAAKKAVTDAMACKEKAEEIFGDDCVFLNYIDRITMNADPATSRRHFNRMLEHIRAGVIEAVVVTYMGVISTDIEVILDFYRFLKECGCKIITVRDGAKVMDMLEKAIALDS